MDDKVSRPSHGRPDPMVDATSAQPHEAPNQETPVNPAITTAAALTAQWTTALHAARTELTAAEQAEATPEDAARIAARRLAARETLAIAQQALDQAQAAETAARRDAVGGQADTLARQVAKAAEQLAAKRAAWHAEEETFKARELAAHNEIHELAQALDLHTRQQQALDLASRGQDVPGDLLPPDQLPDSLQPGGVLPVPAALAAQEAAQQAEEQARVLGRRTAPARRRMGRPRAAADHSPGRAVRPRRRWRPGSQRAPLPRPTAAEVDALAADLAGLAPEFDEFRHDTRPTLDQAQRESLLTCARLVGRSYAENALADMSGAPAASTVPNPFGHPMAA